MSGQVDKLVEVIRRVINRLYPELANRYHLVANARVVSARGTLTLQPLKRDGTVDESSPVIVHPPLPSTVKAGDVLRIGYAYGDPSESFVLSFSAGAVGTIKPDGFLPDGHTKAVPYITGQHVSGLVIDDRAAGIPIEEGARFVIVAKL
ncbi:MAG: hypothetical protein U1D96_05435 [Eubacteriales bacterium]|nr:hypothetical protein [Eubacteriales bacterium]